MLLPHFDRPLSRPPEGHFTINHLSQQANGLVGWWPSLATRGGNLLRDLSGFSRHGTFAADTAAQNTPEVGWGNAFDGTGDYIEVADDDDFSISKTN